MQIEQQQERPPISFENGPRNLSEFEQKHRFYFDDKNLLKRAFTHRSYGNENKLYQNVNNERLEFLGDSVIQLIVTTHLYKKFPQCQEGDLTNYRSALVNTSMFAEIAQDLEMQNYVLLSKGQRKDVSFRHILADTFEAFVAALYLDQGYSVAETFVSGCVFQRIDRMIEEGLWRDWKTVLQTEAQEYLKVTPTYEVVQETGSDHNKVFTVVVKLDGRVGEQGFGKSKREAEKDAAKNTLLKKKWFSV